MSNKLLIGIAVGVGALWLWQRYKAHAALVATTGNNVIEARPVLLQGSTLR